VGDKKFGFCPVPWPPVCPIPKTVFKSNTVLHKLFCPIPYFLTDQTHLILQINPLQKKFQINSEKKYPNKICNFLLHLSKYVL
jgi:hypothetical protein